MRTRRASLPVLACLALAGCDGGESRRTAAEPARPPAQAEPPPAADAGTPTPPLPTTPPVSRRAYLAALDRYCRTTVGALERLVAAPIDEDDPVRVVATFARRYRAGVERLGARTPPAALRRTHLLVLAQGRESVGRIEAGVRLGRRGDTDAATTALGELESLIPQDLPRSVRRGAPACD